MLIEWLWQGGCECEMGGEKMKKVGDFFAD